MDKLMQEYKQECAIYSKIASSIWKIGLVIISILYIKLSYGGQNYFEKFILFLRSSDYTKGVYKKVGQSTQGRLARNRVCVAFSLILIEGHRCWCKNNFLTHLIFSLSA